jgi:hypothetical protein
VAACLHRASHRLPRRDWGNHLSMPECSSMALRSQTAVRSLMRRNHRRPEHCCSRRPHAHRARSRSYERNFFSHYLILSALKLALIPPASGPPSRRQTPSTKHLLPVTPQADGVKTPHHKDYWYSAIKGTLRHAVCRPTRTQLFLGLYARTIT